jgi:hypothetical protein
MKGIQSCEDGTASLFIPIQNVHRKLKLIKYGMRKMPRSFVTVCENITLSERVIVSVNNEIKIKNGFFAGNVKGNGLSGDFEYWDRGISKKERFHCVDYDGNLRK